jgi:4'-phosphopantetheinyl transferase
VLGCAFSSRRRTRPIKWNSLSQPSHQPWRTRDDIDLAAALTVTALGTSLGTVTSGVDTADVWYAWVGAAVSVMGDLTARVLSAPERERLSLYRNESAAARYVVTRSLVRSVLGNRMAVPASDVPIGQTDFGKPVVAGALHFNVSHSGDLVLMALSADRAVGIDVERRRAVERSSALVARWLTGDEQRDVAQRIAGGADPSDAFLRVWSLKEARLKALGVGIANATHADVGAVAVVPLDGLLEQLHRGDASAGYIGAVAFA